MMHRVLPSRTNGYPYCIAIATLVILSCTGRAAAESAATSGENGEDAAPHIASSAPNKPNSEDDKGPPCTWTPGTPPGLPTCTRIQFNLGLAWWLVQDKGIFGPTMRIGGRWITGQLEWNLIRLWDESPYLKSRWLGSIFGFYLSVSPIHGRRLETHLGLGGELHWLHGIHSEELKPALGAKASIHWMFDDHAGVFGSARTYLATGEGLGLGEAMDRTRGLPVVFSFGFEFRTTNDEDKGAAR